MAVPIILGVIAGGGAIYGAIKGVKGAVDQSEASDINDNASRLVDKAKERVEKERARVSSNLEEYGCRKLRAFDTTIEDFLETFKKIKNVELIDSPELDELKINDFENKILDGLQDDYQALKDAGLGVGAGITGGAALAFGAYNGTMMLATASTGTAISTLSGAAATNATLAWLGGGSLAAGGGGMALGTMVLGGVVAGPALAIFGHIMGNKGEEAINNARANLEQARTYREESDLVVTSLTAIAEVVTLADATFTNASRKLRRSVNSLRGVIDDFGMDFQSYSKDAREIVFVTVKCAQLVKSLIDTPILDENGNLVLSTKKKLEDVGAILI